MSAIGRVPSMAERAQVQNVYCSMKQSDLDKCKQTYNDLNPTAQIEERRQQETTNAQQFKTDVLAKLNPILSGIEDSMANIDKVVGSHDSLRLQLQELASEKSVMDKENQSLEQSIRANRRRFLDNDPQEGTTSILGLKTSDDKVLLFFWLFLLVLTNLGVFTYFSVMKKEHVPIWYIGITGVVLGIAYAVIYNATRIEYKLQPTTL